MRTLPSSLHDDVASQLRAYIFDGQLRPGSFIDEVTLCELWSISRTPLREALKVLTAEGLVRHEPRRGCFVNEVTEQDLDDIFPVIALLEGRCAHDATLRATPADVQALEVWHQRLKKHADAGRINDYYEANFAIHEALIQLASNKWLAQTIADLRKILKLARLQQLHAPGRLKQSLKEHMAVFTALKARDALGAEAAMRNHLLQQREALRELALAQRGSVLTA
ncbi:MAG: GntR family transcriptional regulator [Limnohabitans sp.]|jgi:DNA-binding GntR family transcriptional regulator|nr:GntR family transcriptional regulator [Limnohabitans sp.]